MTRSSLFSVLVLLLAFAASLEAFTVTRQPRCSSTARFLADMWDSSGSSSGGTGNAASGGGSGSLERIEFKIYPDGRVEEKVIGVKGGNCHKVTEGINEILGEVVASQPTEEMYEQEIVTDQTLYNSESDAGWDGNSSW